MAFALPQRITRASESAVAGELPGQPRTHAPGRRAVLAPLAPAPPALARAGALAEPLRPASHTMTGRSKLGGAKGSRSILQYEEHWLIAGRRKLLLIAVQLHFLR